MKKKSSEHDPVKILTSQHMRKKHVFYAKENQRIFHIISLIVLTIASLFGSLILIPFLIFFSATTVYTLVLLVGLIFGFTFSFMILDLQHLEHKHHIISGIFVPLIAIINIFLLIILTTKITKFFFLPFEHNPIFIASFYLLGFIIPYLFIGLIDYFKNR